MCLSVIIPTVQKKLEVLQKLVETITEDSSIDEILIINNKVDSPISDKLNSKKVEVYTPKENLYVNPSWNFGVTICKNDTFLLLNDDLVLCRNYCSKVLESGILDKENTGLLGISMSFMKSYVDANILEMPEVEDSVKAGLVPLRRYMCTGDWGAAIFGRKSSYFTIPDDLRIIYGDNYLLYKNLQAGRINYEITNLPVNHIHSASCASPEFGKVVGHDINSYQKYIDESVKFDSLA